MPDGYGSHADYMEWVSEEVESRCGEIESALLKAFAGFIERREVAVIVFSGMSALDLAEAVISAPMILKPLLAACNIAARAIERDLSIKNLDTYAPNLDRDKANVISGYIKPFLPPYLEVPALVHVDRVEFIDKEIRKLKGRWEKRILTMLNKHGRTSFKKRKFAVAEDEFELDAASPEVGAITVGVDIKRVEARRDIHKRCDEIVNKASKLKAAYPESRFGAVIYYPFLDEQINVQTRLRSTDIDALVFASESDESVESAVKILLSTIMESR